jgi:hypothetical protein
MPRLWRAVSQDGRIAEYSRSSTNMAACSSGWPELKA